MDEYIVWIVTPKDREMIATADFGTLEWPIYLKTVFSDRQSRQQSHGCLYQPNIPVGFADEYWKTVIARMKTLWALTGIDYEGIVIKSVDLLHVITWPGFVVDRQFQLVTVDAYEMAATLDKTVETLGRYTDLVAALQAKVRDSDQILTQHGVMLEGLRNQIKTLSGELSAAADKLN
jgi:hypothetical protein